MAAKLRHGKWHTWPGTGFGAWPGGAGAGIAGEQLGSDGGTVPLTQLLAPDHREGTEAWTLVFMETRGGVKSGPMGGLRFSSDPGPVPGESRSPSSWVSVLLGFLKLCP